MIILQEKQILIKFEKIKKVQENHKKLIEVSQEYCFKELKYGSKITRFRNIMKSRYQSKDRFAYEIRRS